MTVKQYIFKDLNLISQLTNKYYSHTLNSTGREIINSYPFNLHEFESLALDALYLFGTYLIECSYSTANVLSKKFQIDKDSIIDEYPDKVIFSLKESKSKLSLKQIVDRLLKYVLNDVVIISTFYHTIYLVNITIQNHKIIKIDFDDVKPYDPKEDGNYIDEEMHLRFLLHQIYIISYDVPIIRTLKLLDVN